MTQYIASVHKDQYSEYGVQFYDFPGCITAGKTIEEARKMAIEALTGHLTWMVEDGDEIPTPSALELILRDQDHQDAHREADPFGIAFLVIEIADDLVRRKIELVHL